MELPKYSVVVLYFRAGPVIYRTLTSLELQHLPPHRVVVVDNGSRDGELDQLALRFPTYELITLDENVGYSAGMNAGIRYLGEDSKYVLTMTHEVQLEKSCAGQLIATLDEHDAGMVGPLLKLEGSESRIWSTGGSISHLGRATHSRTVTQSEDRFGFQACDWLDGACVAYRLSVLREVGYFDEDYFLYWEDVDISLRIGRTALIGCVSSAIATQGTANTPAYFDARNQILLWRKSGETLRVVASLFRQLARSLRLLVRGHRKASLATLVGLLHGFSGSLWCSDQRMVRQP